MPHPAHLYAVACRRPQASDADLLAGWATARDADAFTELVRRYGPLVWRTCRAAAGDTPTAEDAFQATFLALSRRAGAVTAVAGFLHRTAGRAARKAARRDRRPPPVPRSTVDPLDRLTARELLAAVDAEIARLPERQRLAVLLCGVDELSTDEAGRRLGWTAGAVRGRLARGRATLRTRLTAKGLAVPAVVGLGVVPDRLTAAVVATACGGPVPAGVTKLVSGGLAMTTWLKLIALTGVLGGLAVAGSGQVATPAPGLPADALVLWEGTTDGAGFGVWHPDGKNVVAVGAFEPGDAPHEVRAWDAANGKLSKSFPVPAEFAAVLDPGESLAVSPDGKTLAAGMRRKEGKPAAAVAVWAWDRPADPPRLLPQADEVAGVTFAGGRLVAVTRAGELSAYQGGADPKPAGTARLPDAWAGRRPHVLGLAGHPTEPLVAVSDYQQVSFWHVERPAPAGTAHPRGPFWHAPAAYTPDGRRLTLFGESGVGPDRRLILGGFDLTAGPGPAGVRPAPLPPMSGRLPSAGGKEWGLNHLSSSPDGRFLALAGKDGTARLADARSAQVVAEWAEATPVRAAHFSPDGRRLLTVAGGAVRVREVADRLVPRPPDRDLRLSHEKERERFAGRWVVAAARIDGKDAEHLIGGTALHVVAVDPGVSPKAANVRREVSPNTEETAYAVYEFQDADTYRLCYSIDADRRPTAFTAEAGSRQALLTLKRAK